VTSHEEERFGLVVARSAARTIAEQLPEAVATAVIEFIAGPLLDNPYRIGHRLEGPLGGRRSARRGTYRVIYDVDDAAREVVVLDVSHRAEAYGPRSRRRKSPGN
jgi:mRNA-degrading endonuclease RelE of RelBE toxin-antitoxin system